MKGLLTSTALAAMLALNIAGASPALADYIVHTKSDVGDHVYTTMDDDGNVKSISVYDKDHKHIITYSNPDSDPNPEGGSTGVVDHEAIIEDAMKNGGAGAVKENNFLETTLGQTLIKDSKTGSIVPFHNPVPIDSSVNPNASSSNPVSNGLSEDPFADNDFEQEQNQGSMGGGWYDPMGGGMVEQMMKAGKKNKGKGSKGSGDAGSDAHDPGYDFPADPALVNPVPIQLPVAKPAKTKVKQVSAPALTQKGKGPIGNLSSYPIVPNLPSPAKVSVGNGSKAYPTIPNLPSPAAANKNRLSKVGTALGRQPGAASGNFRVMQGLGRSGARTR